VATRDTDTTPLWQTTLAVLMGGAKVWAAVMAFLIVIAGSAALAALLLFGLIRIVNPTS
jgi:hypothetical protein